MSALIRVYRENPASVASPCVRELCIVNIGWTDSTHGTNGSDSVIDTTITQTMDNGFLVADDYDLTISYNSTYASWEARVVRDNWDAGEEADADDTTLINANGLANEDTIIEGIDLRLLTGLITTRVYTATIYVGHNAGIIEDGDEEATPQQFWARNEGSSTGANVEIMIVSDAHPVNWYGSDPTSVHTLVHEVRESRYPPATLLNNPVTAEYLINVAAVTVGPPKTYDIEIYTDLVFTESFTVNGDNLKEYEILKESGGESGIFLKFTDELDATDVGTQALIKVSDGKDMVEISDDGITYAATNIDVGTMIVNQITTWYEKVTVPLAETPDKNARKSLVLVLCDTI